MRAIIHICPGIDMSLMYTLVPTGNSSSNINGEVVSGVLGALAVILFATFIVLVFVTIWRNASESINILEFLYSFTAKIAIIICSQMNYTLIL